MILLFGASFMASTLSHSLWKERKATAQQLSIKEAIQQHIHQHQAQGTPEKTTKVSDI